MATPMRSNSQDASHRSRVADPRTTAKAETQASNFEYDDNEWDIGIGNLIIDLDADIEKTNEGVGAGSAMATNANSTGSGKTATKMAIEHSATVDKGLKMKIKRTKPGTKTSEAKHEIVKSNEQNGNVDGADAKGATNNKHPVQPNSATPTINSNITTNNTSSSSNSKRGSSGHRREKTRDKHTSDKPSPKAGSGTAPVTVAEVNGVVRVSASQTGPQRPLFPSSTGPGPPSTTPTGLGPSPGPPSSPTSVVLTNSATKLELAKPITPALPPQQQQQPQQQQPQQQQQQQQITAVEERSTSPPPTKKLKLESKEVNDVCIGTSVGTITEPDCLGPCEPGTSVTLEGIVWHETEGGVLVVNVTWRGKTYVGTLLDCTRHDWAPPRFCDSPTSDLDSRTPKGRGKRGRAAGASPSTDLSNFTETRSSVHSKLRNGGIKGRRGAANGSGSSTAPSSPTPFVPPRPEPNNKRKNRPTEDEATNNGNGKKPKVTAPITNNQLSYTGSPPPSPVLLECPEPNCSKKYKHINGLKYHQTHAHGTADDDDTKDATSMSENDESNIEAPSPVTPVKSPDKSQDSPLTPLKKESELPLVLRGSGLLEDPSQSVTPRSTPPSPETPQSLQELTSVCSPSVPVVESKSLVKPGVLRFNSSEEFGIGVFSGNKIHTSGSSIPTSTALPTVRSVVSIPTDENSIPQNDSPIQLQSFSSQLQAQTISTPNFDQPPTLIIPSQNSQNLTQNSSQLSPNELSSPSQAGKVQFKVKPASALLADDKKDRNKLPPNYKKKSRKSPAGSPNPPQADQPVFGIESSTRDEVQSPAYSDISDDGAPIIEPDLGDKSKSSDKKTESGQQMSHIAQYGMYPFYGQPPYMMPSVQQQPQPQPELKTKEQDKVLEKSVDKEIKKEGPDYQQKVIPQYHYNPYGYMPSYPYNMDPGFNSVPMVTEDKIKEERLKESPSPADHTGIPKISAPIPNPIQVPTPSKLKTEISLKEKQQNENHQILKESIEIKSQMSPYNIYQRQQQSQQRDEEVRRYYVYPEQRRKESDHKSTPSKSSQPPSTASMKQKDKNEEKKEKEIKHEGVKPTMETQGPPPPPTSQYAYIHPSYMQSPHYGALPFDPNHPVYRGIMVPGPYSGNPYLHPQMPRYHAPEDLSRPPPPKTLDMLQHHPQYYPSHKIHELQERAIKSPTPKASVASASPSGANNSSSSGQPQTQMAGGPTSQANNAISTVGKQPPGENKDSRSPPPQRHVHTHHHTHVGLGYPMYPAPYGAAVLASQQAAAVTVINPYPPK